MKKRVFILPIIGMAFLTACYSTERPDCLSSGNSNETEMYIECFKEVFSRSQPIDFNNVTGDVGIMIRNIPSDADKVFVCVDEVQVGNWVRSWEDNFHFDGNGFPHPSGFESNRFSNGRHRIKLVSINSDGTATNYPPIDAYFKNLLYSVRCEEHFHPTQNYHYSGFYDGEKSLEVKLTNYNGDDVLWSNIYSGDYININIPNSVFGTEQLCILNITDGSCSITERLFKKFKKEDWGGIDINEEQSCAKEVGSSIPDGNETTTRPLTPHQHKRELAKGGQAGTGIEFFQVDKYFVPPINETVAILWYPSCVGNDSYQPLALFGDEKLAEKLMGKSLEPKKLIEGRTWLEKIMNAYSAALKEAKEKNFHRQGYEFMGQIIFVTAKKGYMQQIDVDANTVYNNYMESKTLKKYFDELGLTKELLAGEPNAVRHPQVDKAAQD